MKFKSSFIVCLFGFVLTNAAYAKLNVVTTVPDLRAITAEVGKDLISVDSIAKGTQDPHFIEAKPSFMVKVSRADLVVAIGMELEIGWLPSIVQGARNPKIAKGQAGYLEIGSLVEPLEVLQGTVTRAQGDIHPFGNPHIWLDPIRAGEIAVHIANKLAELDPEHASQFKSNAQALQARLKEKVKVWQVRVDRSQVKKIVTYHKTLTYFFDRFHLQNPVLLEPKPGIPPTSGHIIEVIENIKQQKIPLILVENFFDPSVTNRIKQDVPTIRTTSVAVSVDGAPGISTIDDLYESLVKAIEGK